MGNSLEMQIKNLRKQAKMIKQKKNAWTRIDKKKRQHKKK